MQQYMIIANDFNEVRNKYIHENIYINIYLLNSNSFIYSSYDALYNTVHADIYVGM